MAFRQEGMKSILYGKVRSVTDAATCVIRCKNGQRRFCDVKDVSNFFDNKRECYEYK